MACSRRELTSGMYNSALSDAKTSSAARTG